jgi:dCTP deaminase
MFIYRFANSTSVGNMASLVDYQITGYAQEGMIEPFDPEYINPASLDVRLGDVIKVEGHHPQHPEWINWDMSKDGPYLLKPGEFVLGHTVETVKIPDHLECQFQLKSSRAREGLQHLLAGYIDPGFQGEITLELKNVKRFKNILLMPRMRIGQLRFGILDKVPLRPYHMTGRYMFDKGPVASKG